MNVQIRRARLRRLSLATLAGIALLHSTAFAQSCGTMQDLGTLGGEAAEAWDVSADGRVVVGAAQNTDGVWRAFRWTFDDGMQDLGTLGGPAEWQSWAYGVSDDGSVVVGWAQAPNLDFPQFHGYLRAFRWTAATGMQSLGTTGGFWSEARDVSPDGVWVSGVSDNEQRTFQAFRDSTLLAMQDLGNLQDAYYTVALGISANGSTVVGFSDLGGHDLAFRWTLGSGMQSLGTLGGHESQAHAISADGGVIVGNAHDGTTLRAIRWTSTGGMQPLTDLGGAGSAECVSGDGDFAAGWVTAAGSGFYRAARWTPDGTMQQIGTMGRPHAQAHGISSNGNVIVGEAWDALARPRAFRWVGPCCPADFNDSGGHTVQDIFDFLAAYFSNDIRADFNGAGGLGVQDIFDFLAAYFAGCS